MKTRIRYYGILAEIACNDSELISIASGTKSTDLKTELVAKYPSFGEIPLVLFQNQKLCTDTAMLVPGTEVDCMPPFSGG